MKWDVEALRRALENNDEEEGRAFLETLPELKRLKPGESMVLFIPRRRVAAHKGVAARRRTPVRKGVPVRKRVAARKRAQRKKGP